MPHHKAAEHHVQQLGGNAWLLIHTCSALLRCTCVGASRSCPTAATGAQVMMSMVCRCRRCNPICHALYCSEHVGTSTASAGRMPDGGAEQRQRRRGEDGPSQQKRALTQAVPDVWRALYEQNCESVYLRNGHGRAPV